MHVNIVVNLEQKMKIELAKKKKKNIQTGESPNPRKKAAPTED